MDGAERLGTATSGLEERQGPEIVRPLAAWMEAWATTKEVAVKPPAAAVGE